MTLFEVVEGFEAAALAEAEDNDVFDRAVLWSCDLRGDLRGDFKEGTISISEESDKIGLAFLARPGFDLTVPDIVEAFAGSGTSDESAEAMEPKIS